MPRELKPCGTPAAYARHLKYGEEPCAACRAAEAARVLAWCRQQSPEWKRAHIRATTRAHSERRRIARELRQGQVRPPGGSG